MASDKESREALENIFSTFADTEANIVELPDGLKEKGDLKEFLEIVDFFASRYGLGGCRTIEEFVDMIDNTDPVLLKMLQAVAVKRHLDEWSTDKNDFSSDKYQHTTTSGIPYNKHNISKPSESKIYDFKKPESKTAAQFNMKRFLYEWGVPKDKLDSAIGEINKGKIEFKDFSWVNSRELSNMSNEEFKKLKSDISKDLSKTKQFKVSLNTHR